jgi:hypothetical protein
MADPVQDKDFLAKRLEEDRQKMAVEVSEMKQDYNISHRLRASIQQFPGPWIIGALLTGFLLSRLPARRKEVYLWSDASPAQPLRDASPSASNRSSTVSGILL